MDIFIRFWTSHITLVPDAALDYVLRHAKLHAYSQGTLLLRPGDWWPYWNFLLSGAVIGEWYAEDGHVEMLWLVQAGDYFTGIVHAFTERRDEVYIRCLQDVRVLQLPVHRLQEAQQLYHAFSELINILKQRRIDHDRLLHGVLLHRDGEIRFAAFFNAFPQLAPLLRMHEVCGILQISASTYKRAKQRYYRRR